MITGEYGTFTIEPLLLRRLQARTRLIIETYGPDMNRDYGSYGHETEDVLWWYDENGLTVAPGEEYHDQIMPTSDFERYFRGRYSPIGERISVCPTYDYGLGIDYDMPRKIFEALEVQFPTATIIEIF